jgi:hypothetical protein
VYIFSAPKWSNHHCTRITCFSQAIGKFTLPLHTKFLVTSYAVATYTWNW